ncbi:MAG: FtsQ-type POTRA domain-containing protein [Gammaproteobacteria bacterium]|nr:FtsQ-type POTRA domain-containing protein [Gammaproteobacteria bacterium]
MTIQNLKDIIAARMGMLILFVSLLVILLCMPDISDQIAVKKILINKSLQYVEKNDVDALLEQALEKNFFTLDLKNVADSLNELPWVKSAQIKKIWPDTLLLNIHEQTPLARWKEDQLISVSGVVFSPIDASEFGSLPHLFGKESKREGITEFYYQSQRILAGNDLHVVRVDVESTFDWRVELDNGLLLILSAKQGIEKIEQFSRIYDAHILPKLMQISHVDLRYENGFVVSWQQDKEKMLERHISETNDPLGKTRKSSMLRHRA